jgi:hypothetical protein
MSGYYTVEVLHVWGEWWERILLFLWGARWRAWIGPDVVYATEDEARADIARTFLTVHLCQAESSPHSRLRPTHRWRIVRKRGTPWAEGEICEVICEGNARYEREQDDT